MKIFNLLKARERSKFLEVTSSGRSGGHQDVDVGEDPDAELEVLVVSGDVLSSGNFDRRFRNRNDVDVESVVFKVDRLAGGAVQRRREVDQATTRGRELAGVQVGHLRQWGN